MKYVKTLFLSLLVLMLVGCATKEVTVYRNVLIAMPDNMLVDCNIDKPPAYKTYFVATIEQKEDLLVSYAGKQTFNLIQCNDRLKLARKWKADQIKLYPQ